DAARAAGAWGLKATGAGAVGCLLVLAAPDDLQRIRQAVSLAGATVLHAGFDAGGVRVWETHEPD
ncbi:MAG TPA: hypothetical protein VFH97_06725, partial [Gemmatimonadales bacterium]|nr:hypothetical protein [Gemmatimonadales bacterium]